MPTPNSPHIRTYDLKGHMRDLRTNLLRIYSVEKPNDPTFMKEREYALCKCDILEQCIDAYNPRSGVERDLLGRETLQERHDRVCREIPEILSAETLISDDQGNQVSTSNWDILQKETKGSPGLLQRIIQGFCSLLGMKETTTKMEAINSSVMTTFKQIEMKTKLANLRPDSPQQEKPEPPASYINTGRRLN